MAVADSFYALLPRLRQSKHRAAWQVQRRLSLQAVPRHHSRRISALVNKTADWRGQMIVSKLVSLRKRVAADEVESVIDDDQLHRLS